MTGTELLEQRVAIEREWAYAAWTSRLTYPQMRTLSAEPVERGGLGYAVSMDALRGLVAQARREHGDLEMTRAERVERQQHEIDVRARIARGDLERAHATLMTPKPVREDFGDALDYRDGLAAWAKLQEAAGKTVESAERRLALAMKDERDMHGLNAPTKIEADVTTHDAVMDDLNAALASLGREPITADS